jgi:plastocyanin
MLRATLRSTTLEALMRWYTLILLATLALPAGCGDDETAASTPRPTRTASAPVDERLNALGLPRDARITVMIKDLNFSPKYIQGHPGQTLVFKNADTVTHRIKARFGVVWDSGKLAPGESYEVKMRREADIAGEPGVDWICTIHPKKMYGSVIWPD